MKPENLLLKRKHTCQDARCTMENLRCVDFGSAAALENGGAAADLPGLCHDVASGRGSCNSADTWPGIGCMESELMLR